MGIRNFTIAFLLILALVATLAGCANSFTDQPDMTTSGDKTAPEPSAIEEAPVLPDREPTDTPYIETPDRIEQRPSQTLPAGLERVETPDISPVVGEVPTEILEEIIADLVQRTGAERQDIEMIRAEAVVWNDGSLGCPKPGEFYIQILVNGYWVILQVEGVEYDYRLSDSGNFILCEGNGMPSINSPDTGAQTDNPLVILAKGDLAERLGIQITAIELLKIEEVTGRDGSLGCPQPGMVYAQVITPGYWIVLEVNDQKYPYHTDRKDQIILCIGPDKEADTQPTILPVIPIKPGEIQDGIPWMPVD